ncbi:MAG TPA: response regulator [Planctomycetaceae bacterium]|nr:response regulator [Planctomycetaceae bacterium]
MSGETTRPKCVLLCDDEFHILRAAEFKFRRAGFEVLCASDGVEALERVQTRVPDVVVTDCQMPRMNGLELIERLRQDERTRDVPILMLTAKGFELPADELVERFHIAGVAAKPFSPRELLRRVESLIEEVAEAPAT